MDLGRHFVCDLKAIKETAADIITDTDHRCHLAQKTRAFGHCPACLHLTRVIVKVERHLQIRTLCLDMGRHLTASVNLDQIGAGSATKVVEIAICKSDIVAVKPPASRRKRGEINPLKRGRHRRAKDMETAGRAARGCQIVDHCRNSTGIGWSKAFLRWQQNINAWHRGQGGKWCVFKLMGDG